MKEAVENHTLRLLYDDSVSKAQKNKNDAACRYIAVLAYVEMVRLTRNSIKKYENVLVEAKRVLRIADQAVAAEPRKAYPLLAKAYLVSTLPDESFGPRPPEQATRTEYRWFTETNPRTGEVKRERRLVYVFKGADPRATTQVLRLLNQAIELEPTNAAAWLLKAAVEEKPNQRLACVRTAARFGGKEAHPTAYLLQAYRTYSANGLHKDAAIARAALQARLKAAEGKVWVKLFRKVHKDFSTPD